MTDLDFYPTLAFPMSDPMAGRDLCTRSGLAKAIRPLLRKAHGLNMVRYYSSMVRITYSSDMM